MKFKPTFSQEVAEMFDFITNFLSYLENLLDTIKDLTGIEIDFGIVEFFLNQAENLADFIISLLEYILQEVSAQFLTQF